MRQSLCPGLQKDNQAHSHTTHPCGSLRGHLDNGHLGCAHVCTHLLVNNSDPLFGCVLLKGIWQMVWEDGRQNMHASKSIPTDFQSEGLHWNVKLKLNQRTARDFCISQTMQKHFLGLFQKKPKSCDNVANYCRCMFNRTAIRATVRSPPDPTSQPWNITGFSQCQICCV